MKNKQKVGGGDKKSGNFYFLIEDIFSALIFLCTLERPVDSLGS